MNRRERTNAAREEMIELLITKIERAHELATMRMPTAPRDVSRHFLKIEAAGKDAMSVAAVLRMLGKRLN